jgi:hypothetical protein
LTHRNGIPFGTWQDRFIDWFRDLGFLEKSGLETKAARDVAEFQKNPPSPAGRRPEGPRSNTPSSGTGPATPRTP